MPKELNLSTNERIDLEDFQYGTRTFTVDALRAHVSRIVSGGYRGGFVLEGFRVEIPNPLSENQVTVYNGIALDRAGRLITNEEGNLFLNNSKYSQTVKLLNSVPNNYLMVEYTLEPVDYDGRAFWDPTYENPPIVDSGNDNVPQPKGKEFTVSVPTRKAQSWTIIVSGTGFEDATDPNKIRIPIAIIPIDAGGTNNINLTLGTDTDFAQTTLIEQPVVGTVDTETLGYLRCADTRMFPDSGVIKLYDPSTNGVRPFSGVGGNELTIVSNDRENNVLYVSSIAFINPTVSILLHPRVGDVVRVETTTAAGENLLLAGGAYDCRPMLFSFTDSLSATKELTSPWTSGGVSSADRLTEPRNNRYWAARSLITDPDTTGNTTKNYPADVSYGQHKSVPVLAPRVENRIKQEQDFFRVLGALLLEMKYGVPEDVVGAATETTLDSMAVSGTLYKLGIRTTAVDKFYLVDTTQHFSQSLVGSWVRCTDATVAANFEKREQIAEVIGDHVLKFTSAWPVTWTATDTYVVEKNYPSYLSKSTQKGFVDAKYTGSLEEVYDGRVDQFTDSYAEDLNRRLSINKVATITVGDGINTHGDFTGGAGLLAAFKLAYDKKRGAHIHIRRGEYLVQSTSPIAVGPNTLVTGEGKDATIIKLLGNGLDASATPNYFLIRDYFENYLTPGTTTIADIRCNNIQFKDLTLQSADAGANGDGTGAATWLTGSGFPLISNVPLGFSTAPMTFGVGAAPAGIWLPNWTTATNTASLVQNFTLDNVHLIGGGRGDWATGQDTTYAVYISADEQYFEDYVNKDISFINCTFDSYQGGTAVLKACQKVSVKDCDFRNGTPLAVGQEPTAGIVFCSRVDNQSEQYRAGKENSDGDVSITGCTFEGTMYTRAAPDLRFPWDGIGWITFTPTYLGQDVLVSSCNFRGDLLGDSTANTYSWRQLRWGFDWANLAVKPTVVGVVNCSPHNIAISSCEFHTMKKAVVAQTGLVTVDSCNFWNCDTGIYVRPEIHAAVQYNYARFSGTIDGTNIFLNGINPANFWTASKLGSQAYYYPGNATLTGAYTRVHATSCTFLKGTNGIDIGLPNISGDFDGTKDLRTTIKVRNCLFQQPKNAGISFETCNKLTQTSVLAGGASSVRINENWDLIDINACEFEDSKYAVKFYGGIGDLVKDDTSAYDSVDHKLPIHTFRYQNNSHTRCEYDGRKSHGSVSNTDKNCGALSVVAGTYVVADSNTFEACKQLNGVEHTLAGGQVSVYEVSPVLFVLCGESGTSVKNNVWQDCEAGDNDKAIAMLQIGLCGASLVNAVTPQAGNTGVPVEVSSNTINRSHTLPGVQNGVFISAVLPEGQNPITGLQADNNAVVGTQAQYSGVLVNGPHFRARLSFKNNDFDLSSPNYGLTSVQHKNYVGTSTSGKFELSSSYSNFWEWYSADVTDNKISLHAFNIETLNGSRQYGNDIGCNLINKALAFERFDGTNRAFAEQTLRYSFLGGANQQNAACYVACVDLRRVYRATETTYAVDNDAIGGSVVNVLNNTFNILSDSTLGAALVSKDTQEIMGFRVSKFPMELNVRNNTFNRAPLYVKWSWMCPYHKNSRPGAEEDFGGSTITIDNNSFFNYQVGTTVDINPAVGFGQEYSPLLMTHTGAGYMQVAFTNNVVRSKEGASTNANWDLWPTAVRFWHPDYESWGQLNGGVPGAPAGNLFQLAGGFHVNMDQSAYIWRVTNNHLQDTFFRVTKGRAGGVSGGTYATGEVYYKTNHVKTCTTTTWQHNTFLLAQGSSTGNPTTITSILGLNCTNGVLAKDPWDTAAWGNLSPVGMQINFNIAIIDGRPAKEGVGSNNAAGDQLEVTP